LIGWLVHVGVAQADPALIVWPADWTEQPVPAPANAIRQRAVKTDANGEPQMVVELSRSALQQGHQVNLEAVLLEMRKALQINFNRGGYQSLCTSVREGTLGDLAALQTTCKITLNGNHVMTQTLVAAVEQGTAYAFSYAGSVQGYASLEPEVTGIRQSLRFKPTI